MFKGPAKVPCQLYIPPVNYFRIIFHPFRTKYAKNVGPYKSKNYFKNVMKTVVVVPGKPHEGPRINYSPLMKNICPSNFIIFMQYISSFHNFASTVLVTVMSPGAHNLQNIFNNYNQNKFANPKKSQK